MSGVIKGTGEKTTYWLNGVQVSKRVFFRAFPTQGAGTGAGLIGWKELHSDALGVHPEQIQEARENAIEKGVPTEFLPDGRVIFTSRSHRRAYLQAYGYHDKNGGYGDG